MALTYYNAEDETTSRVASVFIKARCSLLQLVVTPQEAVNERANKNTQDQRLSCAFKCTAQTLLNKKLYISIT